MGIRLSLLIMCFLLCCYSQDICPCNTFTIVEPECRMFVYDSECLPQPQKIGGKVVSSVKEWPYLISLQLPLFEGCYLHFCAGVLIAPNLILTAAHCFDKYVQRGGKEGPLSLPFYASQAPQCRHLGSGRINPKQLIRANIEYIHILPQWSRKDASGDIAVAVIDTEFQGPYIKLQRQPIELDMQQLVRFAGWGAINPQEAQNTDMYNIRQLYEADLQLIPEPLCYFFLSFFGAAADLLNYTTMFCAYNQAADTCGGDSGGPLVIKGNVPENDILLGIICWGPWNQCLDEGSGQAPAIMARIDPFIDWIQKIIQKYENYENISINSSKIVPVAEDLEEVDYSFQQNYTFPVIFLKPDIP